MTPSSYISPSWFLDQQIHFNSFVVCFRETEALDQEVTHEGLNSVGRWIHPAAVLDAHCKTIQWNFDYHWLSVGLAYDVLLPHHHRSRNVATLGPFGGASHAPATARSKQQGEELGQHTALAIVGSAFSNPKDEHTAPATARAKQQGE